MSLSKSAHVLTLPLEILFKICRESARGDLKNLRLTGSVFSSVAAEELFSTVLLTNSLKSFQTLQNISEHSQLRRYVKVIDTDRRTICSCYTDQFEIDGFGEWAEKHAGTSSKITATGVHAMLCSSQDLWKYYANWLEYLSDEMTFVFQTDVLALLPRIISRFPNLKSVRQTAMLRPQAIGEDPSFYSSFKPFIDRSGFKEDTTSGPEMLSKFVLRPRPWEILHILYLANKTSTLTELDGFDFHYSNYSPEAFPHGWELPALKKLTLVIYYKDRRDPIRYDHMLSSCPNLQELNLTYRGNDILSVAILPPLTSIVSGSQHWAGLRSISLEYLSMALSELKSLLSRHKSSLRCLRLHFLTLEPETDINVKQETASWLDVIEFLRQELSLTSVEFSGRLSSGRSEVWEVVERNSTLLPKDCLKRRIEAYVCKGGMNPMTPAKPRAIIPEPWMVRGSRTHPHQPSQPIEGDDTWHIAKQILHSRNPT